MRCRLRPILVLLLLAGCSSAAPRSVRPSSFDWLSGTWRGSGPDGSMTEQIWSPPEAGNVSGVHHGTRDGETITDAAMRVFRGTRGIELLASIDSAEPRAYRLVEFEPGRALFAATTIDYPAEIEFRRSGDELTMRIRGHSGLGAIRETTHRLRWQR